MRRTTSVSLEIKALQKLDYYLVDKEENRSDVLNRLLRNFINELEENKKTA